MNLKKLDALGKPYRIYAEQLESCALDQFINTMQQDAVIQAALMPDAHSGYTVPIGSVVATKDFVFPSFVGYDIGCRVSSHPTSYEKDEVIEHSKDIFDAIYSKVPTGFSHNTDPALWRHTLMVSPFVKNEILGKGAVEKQLGTLGGGNHFIEIGYDEEDVVWITIHTGSRNIGHKIASHYMALAAGKDRAEEGFFGLEANTEQGFSYLLDASFAEGFAEANHLELARRVDAAMSSCIVGGRLKSYVGSTHNNVKIEDGMFVHRKGATPARKGMPGVIPGNMRDGVFIVRGLGNPDSLCSSSHGAGRIMSRSQAKKVIDLESFTESMSGIQALVTQGTLDESPAAYKNIFEVLALQKDLIEVVSHIKPLINIKGLSGD